MRDYDKICKLFNAFGIGYCVCLHKHIYVVTISESVKNNISFIFDIYGKFLQILI